MQAVYVKVIFTTILSFDVISLFSSSEVSKLKITRNISSEIMIID